MAVSPSITYCTDWPARMIAVMREETMVIFSFNQPYATTVRHRKMPVATITFRGGGGAALGFGCTLTIVAATCAPVTFPLLAFRRQHVQRN